MARSRRSARAGTFAHLHHLFRGVLALFAKWHDWQGGLTFATRMLSEGYPLWMPLVLIGWKSVRNYKPARAAVLIGGAYSVIYQLANLATFDATTPLNAPHRPWTPQDHFFIVHVSHFGAAATLQAVAMAALLFLGCVTVLLMVLRLLLVPGKPAPEPS